MPLLPVQFEVMKSYKKNGSDKLAETVWNKRPLASKSYLLQCMNPAITPADSTCLRASICTDFITAHRPER